MDRNEKHKVAVIYYCFNRVEHTQRSLPNIIKFKGDLPLFIYCDAPKTEDDMAVAAVRDFVGTISPDKAVVIYRDRNFGLAHNVIDGVNTVFEKGYESIIVLEDDCVPHENFFNYMLMALHNYEHEERMMHISGFALPMRYRFKKDNYFMPYPCSWGWGTWKNKWLSCDFEDDGFYNEILNDNKLKKEFDSCGKSFSYFLKLQLEGKINSWLIRWYAHIFKNEGVSSWATNTLLTNIGFDGSGEHKVKYDRFNQHHTAWKKQYTFEENIEVDPFLRREFKQHFMGPRWVDKVKTMIYLKTGIIFEKRFKSKKC